MKYWMTAGLVLGMTGVSMAAGADVVEWSPLPVAPSSPVWAGVMVQIILGLFIAAAAIGPLVAILMPPAPEPAPPADDEHGHDAHGTHGH